MSAFDDFEKQNLADIVTGDADIGTAGDIFDEDAALMRRRALQRSIALVAAFSVFATLLLFYIISVFYESTNSPQGFYVDENVDRRYRLEHNIFTGKIHVYSNDGKEAHLYEGRMRMLSNVIRLTDGFGKSHMGVFVNDKIYFVNRGIIWSLAVS